MQSYPEKPVLIIDDERFILQSLSAVLRSSGINNLRTCSDSRDVLQMISTEVPALVLLDLTMPHITGDLLLPQIKALHPELPVLIITGVNELSMAVECMKNGATDYLVKAIENSKLISAVRLALSMNDLIEENRMLKDSLLAENDEIHPAFLKIITVSRSMLAVFRYLSVISNSKQTVLIRGETGTGKELVAEAVHAASGRPGDFISINAAGLDDTMFSDSLFGHHKGAYSGADNNRAGLIEKAVDGTLFLDEIGDLSASSQIKLLRLLENGEYYSLGSDTLKRASCRIVAATNSRLEKLMEEGRFRKDLYYRLSSYEVKLPALRNRTEDIPLLIHHFTEKLSLELQKECVLTAGFIKAVFRMELNGNVREIISLLNRCIGLSLDGRLTAALLGDLQTSETEEDVDSADNEALSEALNFPEELPNLKIWSNILVDEALRRSGGKISTAAGLIGISQPALSKRLAKR